jgi:alanine dehydrogenase
METLFLSKSDIESLLTMREAIDAVEEGFKSKSSVDKSVKAWLFFKEQGGDLALWSAYMPEQKVAGMKAIGYNMNNFKHGLPTITAIIILYDPDTSFPIAIMDGTSITAYRTGAAGAVAAKHLARGDSEVVGLIGAGVQGHYQIKGLSEVFQLDSVKIYDKIFERSATLAKKINLEFDVKTTAFPDAKGAVIGSDIVVTATPAREPVVMNDWISNGTHLNAIGADEPGKQELDVEILRRARIFVDDISESIRRGETNVAISEGVLKESQICAELEEVIMGQKTGRTSDTEVTVFDATGIALEDVSVAWEVYKKAKRDGMGEYRRFVV